LDFTNFNLWLDGKVRKNTQKTSKILFRSHAKVGREFHLGPKAMVSSYTMFKAPKPIPYVENLLMASLFPLIVQISIREVTIVI
jgi:hypothetical protein